MLLISVAYIRKSVYNHWLRFKQPNNRKKVRRVTTLLSLLITELRPPSYALRVTPSELSPQRVAPFMTSFLEWRSSDKLKFLYFTRGKPQGVTRTKTTIFFVTPRGNKLDETKSYFHLSYRTVFDRWLKPFIKYCWLTRKDNHSKIFETESKKSIEKLGRKRRWNRKSLWKVTRSTNIFKRIFEWF